MPPGWTLMDAHPFPHPRDHCLAVVLAESERGWATWVRYTDPNTGEESMSWGHYFDSEIAARADFYRRVAHYYQEYAAQLEQLADGTLKG